MREARAADLDAVGPDEPGLAARPHFRVHVRQQRVAARAEERGECAEEGGERNVFEDEGAEEGVGGGGDIGEGGGRVGLGL